jgi:hypothetical protein
MTERIAEQPSGTAGIAAKDLQPEPKARLMASENEEAFRARWSSIQTGFVDEPSRAVKEADELVAEVMKRLAATFAQERSRLEEQWARQKDVSTEDLRIVLQRYRSFFDRLLGGGVPQGA